MRFLISLLLVLTFAVRILVPDGYMLKTGADGAFEIVICTDGGTTTLIVDAEGNPGDPAQGDHDPDNPGSCPFALASVDLPGASLAQSAAIDGTARSLPCIFAEDQRTRIAVLADNAARAPPFAV